MERLREWLEDMTIEESVEIALHYYLIVFTAVGVFLVVLTYRIYRIIKKVLEGQGNKGGKMTNGLTTALVLIDLYLASALLIGSYLPLLASNWQRPRFLLDGLVTILYQRLQEHLWFPMIQIAIIAGGALISLIFLLNALAKLLASEKDRFRRDGQPGAVVFSQRHSDHIYALSLERYPLTAW